MAKITPSRRRGWSSACSRRRRHQGFCGQTGVRGHLFRRQVAFFGHFTHGVGTSPGSAAPASRFTHGQESISSASACRLVLASPTSARCPVPCVRTVPCVRGGARGGPGAASPLRGGGSRFLQPPPDPGPRPKSGSETARRRGSAWSGAGASLPGAGAAQRRAGATWGSAGCSPGGGSPPGGGGAPGARPGGRGGGGGGSPMRLPRSRGAAPEKVVAELSRTCPAGFCGWQVAYGSTHESTRRI